MKLACDMTPKELIDNVMAVIDPYLGHGGDIDRDASYARVWLQELQFQLTQPDPRDKLIEQMSKALADAYEDKPGWVDETLEALAQIESEEVKL